MAWKNTKKAPRSKPTPTAPAADARTSAHSRLVLGFLVNRTSDSAAAGKAAIAGSPGLSAIHAHAQPQDRTSSEGPAADTTFH